MERETVQMRNFKVVGLDLAGVPTRTSGISFLEEMKTETHLLFSDTEILEFIKRKSPHLVTIDAPLSLPPGRKSIQEKSRIHFRPCDEELRKRGIRFFPITLGPMRKLTERGIQLRISLEKLGFRVYEVYPGGAQDILKIPRAGRNLEGLRKGLQVLGIKGIKKSCSAHELDAIMAAYVGLLFLQEKAEIYGSLDQGAILMPISE